MTDDSHNKRRGTRVLFHVDAELSLDNQTIKGEVLNLSLKGMLVAASAAVPVPAGTILDIKIFLSGATSSLTLNMKGSVVRCDENGIALLFKEIDVESFVHLRSVVAYNEGNEQKIMKEFYDLIEEKTDNRNLRPDRS